MGGQVVQCSDPPPPPAAVACAWTAVSGPVLTSSSTTVIPLTTHETMPLPSLPRCHGSGGARPGGHRIPVILARGHRLARPIWCPKECANPDLLKGAQDVSHSRYADAGLTPGGSWNQARIRV